MTINTPTHDPDDLSPIHPGEILLEDFLRPLDMTPYALAKVLNVAPPRIYDLVKEKRGVTGATALRLARYFGTTPQFWMNLQSSYDLRVIQRELGEAVEAEVQPRTEIAC